MKRRSAPLHVAIDATGVARVTFAVPRLDESLAAALCDAALELEADAAVRVVTLSGSGADFCVGAPSHAPWLQRLDCVRAFGAVSKPIIAALHGKVIGEGCELALACDLRIAASNVTLAMPQVARGYLPRCGATQRLPRLIGRMRSLELLLSGRPVAAKEALTIGLVTQVQPLSRLDSALRRMAAELSRKGPLALRYAKEAIGKGADMTFEQGMRLEEDLYVLLQTTEDRREGIDAFLQKRSPRFVGR